ncbi:MAG TPA: DUF4097 family beta strand repeat-containing protein [Aggregatilinea sp.]|uniref:DUF4097 family beta strand repeat-containing protein n=1 Tax=Aggregatilinea sp. TaxID=2806333 RepID=UPI002B62B12A|nr:DUF4097 family beta strand repeat-containing protein [Aggregatilinea sp.]HML23692.1 DUF4097 family beta strand repeat-containing protein [Aggregatilinea sp.]
MINHDDPNVVEPRVPDSEISDPVAYGPEKPKRIYVPETAAPRRRRWPWILLGCLFAPCLCCALSVGGMAGVGAIFAAVFNDHKITDSGMETVAVDPDSPVSLTVDSQVGDVHIRSGATDEVTVEWVKTASGLSDSSARDQMAKMAIDVTETDGTVSVVVGDGSGGWAFFGDLFGSANSVELTITVPDALANLDVELNVGDISISSVDAEELSLANNTGDITYSGTLAGNGPFDAKTNIGSIELTLAANMQADLKARTDIGEVSVVGFDNMSGSGSGAENVTGGEWTGTLGSDAGNAPRLDVTVNIGDIKIRAR